MATTRQVMAVEQQGHGRTADIDRPLRYEQMADDTAALLEQLDVDPADRHGPHRIVPGADSTIDQNLATFPSGG